MLSALNGLKDVIGDEIGGAQTQATTEQALTAPIIPLLQSEKLKPMPDTDESTQSPTSPPRFPQWMHHYRSLPVAQVLTAFSNLSFNTEAAWIEGWAIVQTLCDRLVTGSLSSVDRQALERFCQNPSPTAHEAYLQARVWFGGRSYAQMYRQSNFHYYRAWLSCDGQVKKGHRAFDKALKGESGFALCEKGTAIFMHIYWPHRHDPGGLIHPYGYYDAKSSYKALPYVIKAKDQGCPLATLAEAYILDCVAYRAADLRNGGPLTQNIIDRMKLFTQQLEEVNSVAQRWELPEAMLLKGALIAQNCAYSDMSQSSLAEYVTPQEQKEKGYRWSYQTCLMLAQGFKVVKSSGVEGAGIECAMELSRFMKSWNYSLQRHLTYTSQAIADHVGYFVREMLESQNVYPEHHHIRGMLRRDIDETIAEQMYYFDYAPGYEDFSWDFPIGEGIGKRIVDYHKFIAWRDTSSFDVLLQQYPDFIVDCMMRCDRETILGQHKLPYHFRYEEHPLSKRVFLEQAERLRGENIPAHTFVLMRSGKYYGIFARAPGGMIKAGLLHTKFPKTHKLITTLLASTSKSPKGMFSRPVIQRKIVLCLARELAYALTAGEFLRNAIIHASNTHTMRTTLAPVYAWVVAYHEAMEEDTPIHAGQPSWRLSSYLATASPTIRQDQGQRLFPTSNDESLVCR